MLHSAAAKALRCAVLTLSMAGCASAQGLSSVAPDAVTPAPAALDAAPGARPLDPLGEAAPPDDRAAYAGASRDYERQAREAPTGRIAELLLLAAESALRAGEAERAAQLLGEIPPGSLDPTQLVRMQTLRAFGELQRGRPYQALRALPADAAHLPRYAPRVEELRAQALFQLGDAAAAVRTLVQRERLLLTDTERIRNADLIWEGLRAAQLDRHVAERASAYDLTVRGWIDLALLVRQGGSPFALEDWRRRYPEHPGAERLGMLAPTDAQGWTAPAFGGGSRGGAIALLLPLSGPFAATAQAVRDGFLAAYFAAAGDAAVRVYDAGSSNESSLAAYQRALNDGAGFIVGPLPKEAVAAIAALGTPPAPVLALNYLDDAQRAPFNFFQYGLAPEDEARAAAEHAASLGLRYAVTLVPGTEWGGRVAGAFGQRLQELGGAVLDNARYAQGDRDFSDAIQGLLKLDASRARHHALVNALGRKTEFEPRRRGDVDFIFFAARSQEGRLIWPQFRFHRASELPVYSTSLVFDGGAVEPDLQGVRVCDMPWMIEREGATASLRVEVATLGSLAGYPRLFAFGHDAFLLVDGISRGALRPGEQLAAATGELRMGGGGFIARALQCATLRAGGAEILPAGGAVP